MADTDRASEYMERAAMHEQLAATTSDEPARKMHQAMAAEYRRKAETMRAGNGLQMPASEPRILVANNTY
jgi:hypothetical protein